ncbi:MAG: hypothetical protein ACOC3Z_00215 [Nanoarchaeota archaeon]
MSIYQQMKDDWLTYCLMSSIAYIQEFNKPTENIQIKKYKDKKYRCLCFHSLRLKMNDPEFIQFFFDITKIWEDKKQIKLIGKNTKAPTKEKGSNQDQIYFSPMWTNHILTECGKIPNKYSFETAYKRINHLKQYKKNPINKEKNLFKTLLKNKKLAAGAFIISMDLEFRGLQSGRLSLCMSEKYKDFLDFMLKVAQKWNWTHNKKLSPVNINNSLKLGIKASPQYEFRIHIKGLQEIYDLAGPLINSNKNKCIDFHTKRSKNYINLGYNHKKRNPKQKILNYMKQKKDVTTTELQFILGTGTDVVLKHLHDLNKLGKISKKREGKKYIWNLK